MNKKKDLQKQLENVSTIYVVGITRGTNPHWDKGIWRTFDLYYIRNNQLERIFIPDEIADEVGNWKKNKNLFESRALGLDRTFEIVYNLSSYLFDDGYKLKARFLSGR